MKKLMMLTAAVVAVSTCAHAKDVKRAISPEELFQQAKKECPDPKSANGLPAIRECIAEAKVRILQGDPRIAKACGKHTGEDRTECTDWVYTHPSATEWTLRSRLKEGFKQDHTITPPTPEDPNVVREGRQHQKNEGQNLGRARGNDPHSNKSTITGTIGDHSGTATGGGVSPTNKVSRPNFLGGGTTGSPSKKGGIELGGEVTEQPGNLSDAHDSIKELPR